MAYLSSHTGAQIDAAASRALAMLLTGESDPTTATEGTLGQLYLNTISGAIFRCTDIAGATYTWAEQDLTDKQDTTDSLTAEAAITDSDYFPYYDASESAHRKTLWSNIKGVLKTYFDAIYTAALVVITGYTKPETGGALAATDTINEALGKLEKNEAAKISISAIVDDVTTGGAAVPLSAEQGKTLMGLINTNLVYTTTEW